MQNTMKMKKYIILFVLIFLLSSCFWKDTTNEDMQDLKKEILNWKEDLKTDDKPNLDWQNSFSGWEEERQEKNNLSKNYLTEEKFIEFDDLQISNFEDLEEEITWKTLWKVDKIIVKFSNSSSSFPDDSFQLKKFKGGDEKFLYRAFKKYETIDYGENTYVFEAYSWEKVSKLELKVNIFKEKKEPVSMENLPESSNFWSPREIWNWKVTYTDIKWLEIENVWNIDLKLDSDSITNYLEEKLDSWFFWNTSRYIFDKNWVSFYVVSKNKEEDSYTYSKHYYNWDSLYGILELEKWELKIEEWKDIWEVLKEKNLELKEKNDDFSITKISDNLFKKITN